MMSLANLRPGARFIIVDSTGGLVVAAALDRLAGNIDSKFTCLNIVLISTSAGKGRVLYLSEVDTPPQFPPTSLMNMSDEYMSVLEHLDWAAVDEEHVPSQFNPIG